MKKYCCGILAVIIAVLTFGAGLAFGDAIEIDSGQNTPAQAYKTIIYQIGNPTYYVDGQAYTLKAAPILVEGHAMVPILDISNPLGALIKWDGEKARYVFEANGRSLELTVGNSIARINGVETAVEFNPVLPTRMQLFVPQIGRAHV